MSQMLSIGTTAPGFDLEGVSPAGVARFRLDDYRGRKNVLLVFYPKDNTSG